MGRKKLRYRTKTCTSVNINPKCWNAFKVWCKTKGGTDASQMLEIILETFLDAKGIDPYAENETQIESQSQSNSLKGGSTNKEMLGKNGNKTSNL